MTDDDVYTRALGQASYVKPKSRSRWLSWLLRLLPWCDGDPIYNIRKK